MINSGSRVRQHTSHAGLLSRAITPVWTSWVSTPLDAIIVPAARPAENLVPAITLARKLGTHLVALCSREADPVEVSRLARRHGLKAVTVVRITAKYARAPEKYAHGLFAFDTSLWVKTKLPVMCDVRRSDLSIKRNVGLAIARALDWRRIFFMDDDIRDVTPAALRSTVAALGTAAGYRSVGMTVSGFPDNSVVCHARRSTSKDQDVFVSGSVLAVDTSVPFDFFPDIYNEDWLFFYRHAANRVLGRSSRKAWQLPYDPFADPKRAAGQEFGDVIAEGLYALLDDKRTEEHADIGFWRDFLAARRNFLEEIEDRRPKAPDEQWKNMRIAVQAARLCLQEITPDMCVDYLGRWRNDRDQWAKKLSELKQAKSVTQALEQLSLSTVGARRR